MRKNKKSNYSCDFETTTDLNDCRVWAWASYNIDTEDFNYNNSISSFILWMGGLKHNTNIYFHNLKFDGEFIISYLLMNNWSYSEDLEEDQVFNIVMSKTGQIYVLNLHYKLKKDIVIYDSLKKLPMSVGAIAKAFNLQETKLFINYDEKRTIDHVLTDEEINYIHNDVVIVGKALKQQFDHNLKKMTIGSDALNNYKATLGKFEFKKLFPVLSPIYDTDIRKAYKGGFTYASDNFKNKIVGNGLVFDVNSLYPSVMYNNLLPYGYPCYFEGIYQENKLYPLYIQHVIVIFTIKKDHIPTIQIKNHFFYQETEYLKEVIDPVDLYLTSVDLDLMMQQYDISYIDYIDGYMFQGKYNLFKDYIDYWGDIKATSIGGQRQLAKLMLNSLYGKFGTNTNITGMYAYLDLEGIVKYKLKDPETREPVYTPMATFITAYARYKTITTAQILYKRFCYADTDSIHIIGDEVPDNIEVHPTKLGAWKLESKFIKAKFVRAKTYLEQQEDHENIDVKCAGLPAYLHKYINFDNFNSGLTLYGKLRPCHVKGGIVLIKSTYTLK